MKKPASMQNFHAKIISLLMLGTLAKWRKSHILPIVEGAWFLYVWSTD